MKTRQIFAFCINLDEFFAFVKKLAYYVDFVFSVKCLRDSFFVFYFNFRQFWHAACIK